MVGRRLPLVSTIHLRSLLNQDIFIFVSLPVSVLLVLSHFGLPLYTHVLKLLSLFLIYLDQKEEKKSRETDKLFVAILLLCLKRKRNKHDCK